MPQRQPCGAVVKPGGLDRTGPLLVDVKHTIVCDELETILAQKQVYGLDLEVVPAGSRRGVVQIRRLCQQLVHTVNMGGIGYTE